MSISEDATTNQPTSTTEASAPPRRGRNAATKGRSRSGKKAPTPAVGTKPARARKKAVSFRRGSKTAKILHLLKRPGGVTLQDLTKATGWQRHSVRGFLSGVLGKKMRLKVRSTKDESGERRYSVNA